jgi:hypothetical protein
MWYGFQSQGVREVPCATTYCMLNVIEPAVLSLQDSSLPAHTALIGTAPSSTKRTLRKFQGETQGLAFKRCNSLSYTCDCAQFIIIIIIIIIITHL